MEKQNLNEVSFIRPILIILLVLYHSFAIFDGIWREPTGFVDIPAYGWISKVSYAIMLQMFVFISGYLWAYQREVLLKKDSFLHLVTKKFNRLIIPCLVFSVLYLIFFNHNDELNISNIGVWGGVGHLWFLPMLFWCFVFGYGIIRLQVRFTVKMLMLVGLSAFSIIPIPFRISSSFQYLFFFIGGYYAWLYKDILVKKLQNRRVLLWVVFVILFVSLSIIEKRLSVTLLIDRTDLLSKVVFLETRVFFRLLFAIFGVLALYVTSIDFIKKHCLNSWYIGLGKYCMGVYVFQQFILQYLYYYTSLPEAIGFVALPWISFVIALLSSILLSYTVKSL